MLRPLRSRLPAVLFAIAALAAHPLSAADVRIIRVFPGWRDAGSFKRISEYFTGRENTGHQVILRTHPGERGGFYFLVRIDNPGDVKTATFQLSVITPASEKPVVHSFNTTLPAGETVFNVGLTGSDWPDPTAHPVAWKLDILAGGEAAPLATKSSFLWAHNPAQEP